MISNFKVPFSFVSSGSYFLLLGIILESFECYFNSVNPRTTFMVKLGGTLIIGGGFYLNMSSYGIVLTVELTYSQYFQLLVTSCIGYDSCGIIILK